MAEEKKDAGIFSRLLGKAATDTVNMIVGGAGVVAMAAGAWPLGALGITAFAAGSDTSEASWSEGLSFSKSFFRFSGSMTSQATRAP